jgi:hypothetical protein
MRFEMMESLPVDSHRHIVAAEEHRSRNLLAAGAGNHLVEVWERALVRVTLHHEVATTYAYCCCW